MAREDRPPGEGQSEGEVAESGRSGPGEHEERALQASDEDLVAAQGSRPRRFLVWTASNAWIALLGVIVVALAGLTWTVVKPKPGSLASQLETLRQERAKTGLQEVRRLRADLHGGGRASLVLGFRDRRLLDPRTINREIISDRLDILDEDDRGKLNIRFSYQPRSFTIARIDTRVQRVLRLEDPIDLDRDGRRDVVGAWEDFGMEPFGPRPFLVSWDAGRQKYVMSPLLTDKPDLGPVPKMGSYARYVRAGYEEPTTIRSVDPGPPFRSYAVEDFKLIHFPGAPLLIAVYLARATSHADIRLYEARGYAVYNTASNPRALPCGQRVFLRPPFSADLAAQAVRVWRSHEPLGFRC
jgi:hypothetical protein